MEKFETAAKLGGVLVVLLLVTYLSRGCGGPVRPEMGYVSGKITMDGQPLENVIVVMKPDVGRMAVTLTDKKGYYDIEYTKGEKGTKIGPTTVSFEWPLGYAGPKGIPAAYTAGQSQVKFEVKKGRNKFDLDLKSTTAPPVASSSPPEAKPEPAPQTD